MINRNGDTIIYTPLNKPAVMQNKNGKEENIVEKDKNIISSEKDKTWFRMLQDWKLRASVPGWIKSAKADRLLFIRHTTISPMKTLQSKQCGPAIGTTEQLSTASNKVR